MIKEPILTELDEALWLVWQRAAKVHAETSLYKRRVRRALDIAKNGWEATGGRLAVMWSGGKDSTCMTHLVCVAARIPAKVISEKDDLDFPGEEAYVNGLAAQWNLNLEIIRLSTSIKAWVASNCHVLESLRGRADELSKRFFYPLVQEINESHGGAFLGLRAAESRGRLGNLRSRGSFYTKKDGIHVCTPLVHWSGLDVMAYMLVNDIEPLPLYKCLSFNPEHRNEPWLLRKSWWLPGEFATQGATAWLRRYYPTYYQELCAMWPTASLWS